ncbi:MAG: SpaA isopeptide-forming pilin-related protein, partial [Thermoflexaceae bacterium]|nr:SpaA isopeptide-forming pilin-related protein [Thermoflexaceae bacterium]
ISIKNNVQTILYGTVTVHKTDADDSTKKLSGAVFRLTSTGDTKTYTAEQTTDKDGNAVFNNVPYGTYHLEEIQAPAGYEMTYPGENITIGNVSPAEVNFSVDVSNKQLKGNLLIIKKESGTSNVLSGASFKLTNTTTGTVIGTQTTDNSGTATFSGLPYGTYMLEETNAPAYFSIDDESRNIIINGDTLDASNNYSVEVTDTRLSFCIGKTASNKTGQLAGAGLYIKAADDNTQYDGTSYNRNRLIAFTTADTVQTLYLGDDPGQYQLKPGKYILVEKNAPAGYAVGAEIPFEIQYDSVNDTVKLTTGASNAVVSSDNLTLTMVDEPVGDIMITKRDASIENGVNKPLAGAQFKVYYLKDGNPEYLTTEPQSGYGSYDAISGKYSTNAAGQLRINGLKYNTYYFEEVTAPTGEGVIYVLPASPEAVELNESRFNMVDGTGRKTGVSLDIYNQKKEDQTGTLRLIKKDVSTGDKLSGALFSLYRLDGSERVWINDLESDENGSVLFENIKYGNYVLIERTTPKDYQLTQSDSIDITVGNASAAVQKVETQNGMEYYFTLDHTTVVDNTSYPLTLNGNNDPTGGLLEFSLSNTKKTRDFVIRKADKDNLSISVKGAQFALYSDKACTNKVYPTGESLLSSDANGLVTFHGIEYGTYYLKETAPVGFIAQNEPIKVILDDTTEGMYTTEGSPLVITNERIKLSFSKKALGEDTELSGATLVLTNTGVPAIQKIWNTGMITTFRMGTEEEAKYNTDILSAGTYVLREDTAPDGYFATSEITLQINASGEITMVSGSNTAVSGDKHAFTLYDEPYGSVTITKTDSAGRNYLTGAQFKLYKASDVETVTGLAGLAGKTAVSEGITNALGKLVFEEIPYGDYVIYEVKSPDGYLTNETPYTISIGRDDASTADVDESNVKLTVSNEKIITTGKITIKKTGEDGDSSGLNGAVFKVFDSQGNEIVSAETRNNGTEDGMVSFTLPYDTYTITEVIAPEGYSLKLKNASGGMGSYQVDETTHSVVVTLDNSNNDVRAVVSDSKLRGTLAIYKGDSKTLLPLAGAKFKLYTNDGDDTVKEVNLIWPTADTTVTQTGTEGYLRIGNLLYGKYILVETDAPENYILPDDETKRIYYITIDSESEKKCIVKNDAKVASLSIRKTETGNDSVSLKDARYELFDATKTNKIASVVTDETGVGVISDIPYGTYYLKEVTPPTDYKLDENWIEINVPVAVDAQPVVVSDARATGKLIIHKSELDQKDMAVTGAEFTLINKDTTVTRTGITGDDGRIIFTDLLYGTYYLSETTVPEFYSVQEPSYIVEIKKDETHEFIYNRCQYITISKRGTGDITELAGAKLRLKDTSGNIVKEWTTGSEAEKIYFGNASDRILPDTEYILEEVEAPFGYTITSPIHFKTDEDANVEILSVEGNLLDGAAMGNTLVMYDSIDKSSLKKVCLSKKAVGGTEELPGAVITITNSSGTEIVSWTSGNDAKELIAGVKGDLKFDILYSMTEITAPEGYELAESISFRINTDGTIQLVRQNGELSEDGRTLTMRDALTNPSKPDDEGDDEDTPDESIEPKNGVDTGDRTPLTGLIIVLLVSFAVILFFVIRFLRKDKKEEVIIKHDDRFSANQ